MEKIAPTQEELSVLGDVERPGLPPPADEPALITIDLRFMLLIVGVGVAVDLALRRPATGVSTVVLFVAVSAALLLSKHLVTTHSRVLACMAPVFAVWAMLRSSPWLIPLDLMAATGLIVLAVATSTHRSMSSLRLREMALQPIAVTRDTIGSVKAIRRGVAKQAGRAGGPRIRSVGVGIGIAIPVVLVLGSLLASGDALTGAVLGSIGVSNIVGHGVLVTLGAAMAVVPIYRASGTDADEPEPIHRVLGMTEATIVLAAITVLYAGFAALQVAGALGAADEILDNPVDTANWAREGFFQLLWASGLTLSVLLVADALVVRSTSRRSSLWYQTLSSTTALLTIVVVGTSVRRILAYSETFGLTMLRLYAGLFATWIAVVFFLYIARVWRERASQWFGVMAGVRAVRQRTILEEDRALLERITLQGKQGHRSTLR